MKVLAAKERATFAAALITALIALVLRLAHGPTVVAFVISGVSLATLAGVVGMGTEQIGKRLSPGATGVLQGALGNLPELMVGIFSLRAGLVTVVQSALVGSILANTLLVLGLAFVAGGLKNGVQRFNKDQPRMIATLMMLAVSAITVPTLAANLHTAAERHIGDMSIAVSIVLLIVFACSIPVSLAPGDPISPDECSIPPEQHATWPTWLALAFLIIGAVLSAFVSDWFVDAMQPAIVQLHISQAFTGLVIVAIAGNAVENVVGIQFAIRNQQDYAVSLILNSALQVALALTPILCLLSFVIGGAHLTLVMPPLLVAALLLSTLVAIMVVNDGESIWLEGVALIGLYVIIAAAFWWG